MLTKGRAERDATLVFEIFQTAVHQTARIDVVALDADRRFWSVGYGRLAAGDDESYNISVRVASETASVAAATGWWTAQVAEAELRIGHGEAQIRTTKQTPPATWTDLSLSAKATSDTGNLILVFRGADSVALAFIAAALPAGDFAAG